MKRRTYVTIWCFALTIIGQFQCEITTTPGRYRTFSILKSNEGKYERDIKSGEPGLPISNQITSMSGLFGSSLRMFIAGLGRHFIIC